MSHTTDVTVPSGAVRGAIDLGRFPWIRPLVKAYARDFPSVAPLFAGNPADPGAWKQTIARVQTGARHRSLMASVLTRQLERRGAPAAARDAARLLGQPDTVAVVTGQQAGAFGGPLYTLLKALSAIQIAARLRHDHGVPAVPVFWVDAEDHDWDEVRTSTLLDRDFCVAPVVLPDLPGAGSRPVGSLVLDERIEQSLKALAETLAPTEFTGEVISSLGRRYAAGASVATAFAGWIEDLVGRHGMVVFEAGDVAAKPAAAELFAMELQHPLRTSALVREAGAAMSRLGHSPQVEPAEDAANLFYLDAAGRHPIKFDDGHYVFGGQSRSVSDLAAEAAASPERFSPNVVLRPIVQDWLFPTVCYVAGPSELAYQAQLGSVYAHFGVEAPLLQSRASVTLLDSACTRFLERHDVPFEAFQTQDESVLNQMLERQLPPAIERALADADQHVGDRVRDLRETVISIDPTLAGVVDTTVERIRDTLKNLQTKIVQASKKKDETLRRQFIRTRALAFPDGHPQERLLSVVFFANRYGPGLGDRLLDALPEDASQHYLITL